MGSGPQPATACQEQQRAPKQQVTMATRAVLQTFEKYQKERVAFVSAVAEMAKNPQVCCKQLGATDERSGV